MCSSSSSISKHWPYKVYAKSAQNGSRIITICRWNCCSLTSASPPLTKGFVRTRRIWLLSIPLTVFTRRVLLDTVDLQKENGLLSVQWAVQLEGFLDKKGRGWSRDAVKNNFKNEVERFLMITSSPGRFSLALELGPLVLMIGLKLLVTG